MLSGLMSIPFPEELDDDTWVEKWRQLEFLIESGLLAPLIKKDKK